jgi:hypothetical protein
MEIEVAVRLERKVDLVIDECIATVFGLLAGIESQADASSCRFTTVSKSRGHGPGDEERRTLVSLGGSERLCGGWGCQIDTCGRL